MLSASDLRESQRRLESRAREATERARQKAEKERILAERQAARQAAREEESRQRRLAQLAAEEEVGAGQGPWVPQRMHRSSSHKPTPHPPCLLVWMAGSCAPQLLLPHACCNAAQQFSPPLCVLLCTVVPVRRSAGSTLLSWRPTTGFCTGQTLRLCLPPSR